MSERITFARAELADITELEQHYPAAWPKYTDLEGAGRLRIYTARSHELLAASIHAVEHHLHYASSLNAFELTFHSSGDEHLDAELVAFADAQLQAEGVQVCVRKIAHGAARAGLNGYAPCETILEREL